MSSKFKGFVAASLVAWVAAAATVMGRPSGAAAATPQQSTNDGIYSKVQADGAKAQYGKLCADCHPFSEAGKKKPKDVPLGGDSFFQNWAGRSVGELATTIALTMPNDGSAVVTEEEALNLVAYILQQNGVPAGKKALAKAGESAVVARPKK